MSHFFKVFTISIIFVFSFFYGVFCDSIKNQNNSQINELKLLKLKEFSEKLTSELSFEINPCDNFYDFVCKKHQRFESFTVDYKKLGEILENKLFKNEKLTEIEVKLKDYLNSCKQGSNEDVKEFVKNFNFPNSVGGWPIFDQNWKSDKFDLQTALVEFYLYGIPLLLHFNFEIKPKTLERHLSIKFVYFDYNEKTQKYIREKLIKLGIENVEKIMNDRKVFIDELKNALTDSTANTWNTTTLNFGSLKDNISEINWDKWTEILLEKKLPNSFPVEITNTERLKVIMKTLNNMDPKLIANYMFSEFIKHIPKTAEETEEETCRNIAITYFEPIVSAMFLKEYLTGNIKFAFLDLIDSFLESLHRYIPMLENSEVKNLVTNLRKIISNEYLESYTYENVEKEFGNISIKDNNFIENTLNLIANYKKNELKFYSEENFDNLQFIKIKLHDFPFYIQEVEEKPLVFLFKSLMIVVTKLYTDLLVDFGKLNSVLSDCIKLQTDREKLAKDEIFSYVIMQIFGKTFVDWFDKNQNLIEPEENLLQNYGLSNKKLLFLELFRLGCRARNMADLRYISSLFWNIEEFSSTFNCPVGSLMNPKEKCTIKMINENN